MANKRRMDAPAIYEPSPKQELAWAMDRAVEKAVLAHPRTQKLREQIKQRMLKAAGNGSSDDKPPSKRKR